MGEETEAQSGKGRKKNAGGSLGSLGGLGRNGVGRKTVKFSDGGKRRRAETGRQKKKNWTKSWTITMKNAWHSRQHQVMKKKQMMEVKRR